MKLSNISVETSPGCHHFLYLHVLHTLLKIIWPFNYINKQDKVLNEHKKKILLKTIGCFAVILISCNGVDQSQERLHHGRIKASGQKFDNGAPVCATCQKLR